MFRISFWRNHFLKAIQKNNDKCIFDYVCRHLKRPSNSASRYCTGVLLDDTEATGWANCHMALPADHYG